MTIDERLERLTERHEALTQSVEILTHDLRQLGANVDRLVGVVVRLLVSSTDTRTGSDGWKVASSLYTSVSM